TERPRCGGPRGGGAHRGTLRAGQGLRGGDGDLGGLRRAAPVPGALHGPPRAARGDGQRQRRLLHGSAPAPADGWRRGSHGGWSARQRHRVHLHGPALRARPLAMRTDASAPAPVFGIFVGGRGRRLGGVVKGALRVSSGATILERLVEVVQQGCSEASVVLVGEAPLTSALPRLSDSPAAPGPLGGLAALLHHARAHGRTAVALASDLPSVSPGLIRRVSREHPDAVLYAPRIDGVWQPLFARYAPAPLLPIVDEVLQGPRPRLLSV